MPELLWYCIAGPEGSGGRPDRDMEIVRIGTGQMTGL
jgi:hypothetical protein